MKIPIMDEEKKLRQETKENKEVNYTNEKSNKDSGQTNKDQLDELQSKDNLIEEYKEQLQRVQAEFINYRKRVENERKRDFVTAKGSLILSLLPVLDDFDRMFDHYRDKKTCDLDEIKMLYDNLRKILAEQTLSEIEDKNCEFDPNCHEAVGVVETSPEKDDMILEVLQKGYTFGDRLLRPSRVKVGKYRETNDESEKDSDQ